MVLFHESQCQVHSCCNPGRRIHILVTNKYWVGVNVGPRALSSEKCAPVPMSCRLAAVEQAGSSKEHCAGTDRADSPNPSSHLSDPSHCFNAYLIVLNGTATGYEQSIDLPAHSSKRVMRCDSQSTVGHYRVLTRGGYDFDGIDRRRPGILPAEHFCGTNKDLKWSDQIQNLGARPGNEQHPSRTRLDLLLIK